MWDATTQEEYWKGSSGQDKLKFEDFFWLNEIVIKADWCWNRKSNRFLKRSLCLFLQITYLKKKAWYVIVWWMKRKSTENWIQSAKSDVISNSCFFFQNGFHNPVSTGRMAHSAMKWLIDIDRMINIFEMNPRDMGYEANYFSSHERSTIREQIGICSWLNSRTCPTSHQFGRVVNSLCRRSVVDQSFKFDDYHDNFHLLVFRWFAHQQFDFHHNLFSLLLNQSCLDSICSYS
jgi:hypothetical protein